MAKSPTIAAPTLPAPLTKQKIDNVIASANKTMKKFHLCMATLLFAILFYLILAYNSDFTSSGGYYFLASLHAFVLLPIFIFYQESNNSYGYKHTLTQYSAVDIERYDELQALKNNHKAIAEYINKVGLDGREILNVELKLFINHAKQCNEVENLLKNEQIKRQLYTSESN